MGSVLASTIKYKEAFPKDFKETNKFGDIQIVDPELDKQFSGTFEDKENNKLTGGYAGYLNFDKPFGKKSDFPEDDTIVMNPLEKDIIQRKRTLIHETTHKIARTPDTFSTIPEVSQIINDYFPTEKRKVETILKGYKEEKRAHEMIAVQGELFPSTLYKNPTKQYEKEFYNQYTSPFTQKRLFEPSLIEYPLNKEYNYFEESGVKKIKKFY